MPSELLPPIPGFKVVRLLWMAARRRAAGRAQRQRQILGRRGRTGGANLPLMRLLALLGVCFVHAALGWFMIGFFRDTGAVDEQDGRISVPSNQWYALENFARSQQEWQARKQQLAEMPRPRFEDRQRVIEALRTRDAALLHLAKLVDRSRRDRTLPETRAAIERQFLDRGTAGFVPRDDSFARRVLRSARQPMQSIPVLGLLLVGWVGMLVCQGEGLELDVQRRRHPMWEWLLSHPIQPAHAFYADLLTPLVANPIYLTAPIFFWILMGDLYGGAIGLLAALLIGLPIAVATSALNKAIETTALLRLNVRSRGALLGLLSWFGYIAMLLPLLTLRPADIGPSLARFGASMSSWFPAWPVRALLTGWGAEPRWFEVVASWWTLALAMAAVALLATRRATAHGLQAPIENTRPAGAAAVSARSQFGRDPVLRKELLWLLRDRGAVVQVVLIPLTIAATQAFQFRGLYNVATTNWSAVCGLAIICGTYFLLVLGPRSLASEGAALWLALTWPRGLEDLLKAKARLWERMSNAAVGVVLTIAAVMFPAAWWKILLVGCGWLVFSRTLSLKSVALVTPPSSSGEAEPPNRAAQWIAMIGTLAFGTGVVTGAWHVALIGIVFSSLVAVAMWQRLRARLPFLFDPWSEEPVPAPSLLHAAVGIALFAETIGLAVGVASAVGGAESLWLARAIAYGLVGGVACVAMHQFLARRGVRLADVVRWSGAPPRFGLPAGLALGVTGGAVLAVLAIGYLKLLRLVPAAHDALEQAAKLAASHEGARVWIMLVAVGFAPVAEEYFFRGLLFRTLDRELSRWHAVLLSAAFFAIVHPPLGWVPVAGVGIATAWLFRHTRNLLPSVACHMTYNAVLLLAPLAAK